MTAATLDAVLNCIADQATCGRVIVALAGAPGSGKSTLAEQIAERLNASKPGFAAVLPMDGFHFDDSVLDAAGLRPRKGAPDTFDVGGLRHTLQRLRARDEDVVAVPVFDRDIEIARAGARLIPCSVAVVVAEGNYLLLDRPPWAALRPLFDVAILLDVPEPVLRMRLEERWRGYGLDDDAVRRKIDGNDLPNARAVMRESCDPDIRLA
ncbi:nucleoside triphosphate hydrolase [Alsobacter metallidurans]|uniref:Nucleoside triphosphate hydrolase n=1 Tax=Alsobacter metallidurans TaxID=340221 RepID=A0A917I5D1_9HYPH|nr:nucleoside/nucleotide kinase family protein [Alsobacter metallidurans]GGH12800.1 nucleoside triphosphate hydrolase [Alsobacter metallidurans]